jgi:hypothetical protein
MKGNEMKTKELKLFVLNIDIYNSEYSVLKGII